MHKCPFKDFKASGLTLNLDKTIENMPLKSIYPDGFIKINLVFRNRNKYVGRLQWSVKIQTVES